MSTAAPTRQPAPQSFQRACRPGRARNGTEPPPRHVGRRVHCRSQARQAIPAAAAPPRRQSEADRAAAALLEAVNRRIEVEEARQASLEGVELQELRSQLALAPTAQPGPPPLTWAAHNSEPGSGEAQGQEQGEIRLDGVVFWRLWRPCRRRQLPASPALAPVVRRGRASRLRSHLLVQPEVTTRPASPNTPQATRAGVATRQHQPESARDRIPTTRRRRRRGSRRATSTCSRARGCRVGQACSEPPLVFHRTPLPCIFCRRVPPGA